MQIFGLLEVLAYLLVFNNIVRCIFSPLKLKTLIHWNELLHFQYSISSPDLEEQVCCIWQHMNRIINKSLYSNEYNFSFKTSPETFSMDFDESTTRKCHYPITMVMSI